MSTEQIIELESLKSDAASEETSNSFMEPKKKGRGRPKGSTNKAKAAAAAGGGPDNPMGSIGSARNPAEDISKVKDYLKPVVELLSMKGAQLAEDPRGAMAPTEIEIITDAAANCVNQYLPGVLGEHANAIVLLTALGTWGARVFVLRQMKLAEMMEMKRQREAAGTVEADVQPAMN